MGVTTDSFVVQFKNKKLESIIRTKLNKPKEDLQKSDLNKIDSLSIFDEDIMDISDLATLTNLQNLSLVKTKISDISSLKKLTKLRFLRLDVNEITDISALKTLKNLQQLDLSFNGITDISALKRLTKLESLTLVGNEIKDILIKKCLEGVRVIFIIDKVGSYKLKHSYIKELKDAGVEVVYYTYFLAPLLRKLNTQINYRNHRKIAIIDGKVGFLGGMNIGDEYLGKGKLGYWRDTHIMVKGDFVLGLQAVFLNDYFEIKHTNGSNDIFIGEADKYIPMALDKGNKIMQLVHSGPDSEYPSIMQCVLKMISMAQKSIWITTPYFIPTESLLESLKVAALGGVEIKILFPGRFDHYIVYQASQTYLRELLKCGAKIYFYDKKAFIHSKVITIDGEICNVGTANMDIRSYMLNYEVNTVIYDKEITARLDSDFIMDLQSSIEITEEYFDKMPVHQKFIQSLARVLSYLL